VATLYRVIASGVFFILLAQVFPVFYFPATCGPGALRFCGRKFETLLFCGVLSLMLFFIPLRFWAVFAAAAALSGFFAGGFMRSARKYFAVFFGIFFTLLTAWLLFCAFSGREVVSVFFSKISRILLYTFAGQGELAPGRAFAFRMVQIIPAAVFIFAVLGFFLNTYVIRFLLKDEPVSRGGKNLFQKKIAIIPAPVYLLIASIIGEIFFRNSFSRYIAGNVLVISVFFFFLAGMGIFRFILAKVSVPVYLRDFCVIFLVFMYPVPAVTGILNVWVDFKKRIRGEGGIK